MLMAVVVVALKGESILRRESRIDSKARPALSPRVRFPVSIGQHFVAAVEILAVDAEMRVPVQRTAVACTRKFMWFRSAPRLGVQSLRVRGALGDDVDDTIDRVRAPQRASRPTDDFDSIDVFQQIVLHVPQDSRVE